MATITKKLQGNRKGFRIRFYHEGKRREIYVPGDSKKVERQSQMIAQHIEELVAAKANNVPPSSDAQAWAAGTEGSIRDLLVTWGLVVPLSPRLHTEEGRFLGAFCDAYITSRTDLSARTVSHFKQVRRWLVAYFGERRPLESITASEAERWKRWLMSEKGLAQATTSKHIKRAKQIFNDAINDRLLTSSPFASVKGMSEANSERLFFVDRALSEKILSACPDIAWRCVFALCRFCGMRCPSEVLGLKWSDIDWEKNRIRISEHKTRLRYCPLFPEVAEVLREAKQKRRASSDFVVDRYRDNQQLRTQFRRILDSASIRAWPKLFHNLRSSCRTELQERFPSHVIDVWLGHSTKVAEMHYLQVTDEHWSRATISGAPTGAPVSANTGVITKKHINEKSPFFRLNEHSCYLLPKWPAPPTGFEPATSALGKPRSIQLSYEGIFITVILTSNPASSNASSP